MYTCVGTAVATWSDDTDEERSTRLIDVLDRVLDKGIVINAQAHVSAGGIHLITMDSRVVVASFDAYLARAHAVSAMPWRGVHWPRPDGATRQRADASDLPPSEAVVRAVEEYLRQLP